ncbi:MAG: dTDP-4-dehydrorhamnose 3,5-epimerase [Candidatus Pacearchaeota archaeon]
MEFSILEKALDGVVVLKTPVFLDSRGFFSETYRKDKFKEIGILEEFVQDNHSGSIKGVLRGLHFQWDPPMGKLMRVTKGEAYLVCVDIRKNSPYLGKYHGIIASEENRIQVYAPAGFARGFYAISNYVEVQYKCTAIYNPKGESAILWNDPNIGIEWPTIYGIERPILSEKDRNAQTLEEWLKRPESEVLKY